MFVLAAVLGGLWLSRQALVHRAEHRNGPPPRPGRPVRPTPSDRRRRRARPLAATINDLLDRLAAFHAQWKRFTADASHDLRSPLAALRAAIEVTLQQPREGREYRQVLGNVSEQCDRLTELVDGLLLLARADAGQVELRREPVDLAALVGEVIDIYMPLAEERGVGLKWDQPPPAPVLGDSSRLGQLVTNLLDNALKFTEPGGDVAVSVTREGREVHLVVSDTGIGIPTDHLPHIFDRFYQADAARSSGGSGLGLSICRWIVESHGGEIRATSGPERGSSFTAILPSLHSAPTRTSLPGTPRRRPRLSGNPNADSARWDRGDRPQMGR